MLRKTGGWGEKQGLTHNGHDGKSLDKLSGSGILDC